MGSQYTVEGIRRLMRQWRVDLSLLGVAAIAGAGVGLFIGGIGARVAMRVVAYLIAIPASFSAGGTMAILLLSLILGAALGILYGLLQRLMPLSTVGKGLLYGVALSALFVVFPFLSGAEGELALVSPMAGIALFSWIPLLYGLAIAVAVSRYIQIYQPVQARRVHVAWLAGFGCALVFAFASMSSLMSENVRTPGFVRRVLEKAGVTFHQVGDVEGFLGAGIVLAWLVLAALIFWLGYDSPAAKLSAILLLIFAGAFFHREHSVYQWFEGLSGSRWLVSFVHSAGLGALLLLFTLVPDGLPLKNWPLPIVLLWAVWLIYWFLAPASILGSALPMTVEAGLLAAMAILLMSGLIVQFRHCVQAQPGDERRRRFWMTGGFAVATIGFILMWSLTLFIPDMRLRQVSALATAFAVAPYLMPWLALPAAVAFAMWRYRSVQASSQPNKA